MRLYNWYVPIVQQQQRHFGEETMKVLLYAMLVVYSKCFWEKITIHKQ